MWRTACRIFTIFLKEKIGLLELESKETFQWWKIIGQVECFPKLWRLTKSLRIWALGTYLTYANLISHNLTPYTIYPQEVYQIKASRNSNVPMWPTWYITEYWTSRNFLKKFFWTPNIKSCKGKPIVKICKQKTYQRILNRKPTRNL